MKLPKTESELKNEWGLERFVTAMGVLSGWMLTHSYPVSSEQLQALMNVSEDALTLFSSRLYYQTAA